MIADGKAILHRGAAGTLELVRCSGWRTSRGPIGFMAGLHFVLPHKGSYLLHAHGGEVFADATRAVLFPGGQEYASSHPLSGDVSSVLHPARGVMDAVSEGAAAWGGERICDFAISNAAQLAAARLRAAAEQERDPLEIDELMIDLLTRLVVRGDRPARAPSPSSRRVLDRARAYLHAHGQERLSLAQVAAAAEISPIYLTQLFRAAHGVPLYRYALGLRLAAALDALPRAADITALALDLGFSSHSHFTAAFTQRFGRPPSAVRTDLRGRSRSKVAHRRAWQPLCEARGGRPADAVDIADQGIGAPSFGSGFQAPPGTAEATGLS